MKNIYVVGMIIALAALVFAPLYASGQVFFMENPNIGKTAEDFALPTLKGGETSLSEIREGGKAIVFFWATWCPHCREALDNLEESKQQIEDQDIKIVLVDVGEEKVIVKNYFEKNNIVMDVLLDEKSEIAALYGVIGIPTFYFIGEDGIIRNVKNTLPPDLDMVFYGT